ncbi:TraT conjugal transfer protein (plasmid) [Candidatus Fukatsuia symbiotica]|uniref:TraT conjugal transfer protein n=1 Tax=Candidatus Fukatsuia symbiotica TaxID=1878942 RepID=A0A2U8I8S8_9GAMM|nr:TraT conjugal transfer protein [Candidatus Fukatsuia symbiotica]AWK15488.1 TraT conjugal transfer protein [Candidatus Fukatsuia symbiotica]MEA9445876.1 TraT conjugal transfer protein [Candidatus Fukatsuia symbiotica]
MLVFSLLRHTWGQESQKSTPDKLHRQAHENSQHQCEFCGYTSKNNHLHFVDHNPLNHHSDNLTVVDPLCKAWQNLGALDADDGFVVYLPEIRPEDVNHLQRAAILALQSADPAYRDVAKTVINWLAAHKKEVEAFWGTAHPGEFAEALMQAGDEQRTELQSRWRHLALILNPKKLTGKGIFADGVPESDTALWADLYKSYLSHD